MTLLVTIKSLGDVYFGNDDDGDGCGQTGAVDRIVIYIVSIRTTKPRKLNSLIGFFHHTQHTMKKIPVHFHKSHLVVAVYFLYSLFSHSNCTHQPAGMISEADTDYAGAGFEAKYISGRGLLEEKMPT